MINFREVNRTILHEMADRFSDLDNSIIPFDKEIFLPMVEGSNRGGTEVIEGDDILQVRTDLRETIGELLLQPRTRSTFESVGYVLRCNRELLFYEYHEVKSMFVELCQNRNMLFNYGVVADDNLTTRINLTIFYFSGVVGENNLDDIDVQ